MKIEQPAPTRPVSTGASTLEDIARLTGVSAMTVSRALNKPDKVNAKTRQKIWDAVEQLGYIPNQLANALTTNQSMIIALMIPTIANSIYSTFVQGLTEALAKEGYHVLLGITHYDAAIEEDILMPVLGRRPDAVILTGTQQSERTKRILQARNIPVVQAWDLSSEGIDQLVGFNHSVVGRHIGDFAVSKGYRNIGLLWLDDIRGGMRLAAVKATLQQQGIEPRVIEIVSTPASQQSGRNGLSRMLEQAPDLDLIICSSDELAMGVFSEARHRHLQIPKDLAVMGFGDLDAAASTEPPLTTVRVNSRMIGEKTAAVLLQRLANPDDPTKAVIDTGFAIIERDSA